jgi:hypothetical protein
MDTFNTSIFVIVCGFAINTTSILFYGALIWLAFNYIAPLFNGAIPNLTYIQACAIKLLWIGFTDRLNMTFKS